MFDNAGHGADEQRKNILCCNPNEVATIVTCLSELKNLIACVLDCTDDHSSGIKERIILCKLLDEIRQIEAKLDNPMFGLKEIKNEIIEINDVVSNSVFGLREVKNEIIDINNVLTNEFFGLNEIKNEIIEINDLLNNATFGIPELKNEIRIIENRTGRTIRLLTNEVFGLNEIKNEIRGIEYDVRALNRPLDCDIDSVRICGCEVGDAIIREIQTDKNSILIDIPQGSAYSQIGRSFSADLFLAVSSPSVVIVLDIVNPPDSGRVLYLDRLYGGTTLVPSNQPLSYESSIALFLQTDAPVESGDTITPRNLNAGSSETSAMDVSRRNVANPPSITVGNFIQIGGLFSLSYNGQIIIPPGHSLSIFTRNFVAVPANTLNLTISAVWYELDV